MISSQKLIAPGHAVVDTERAARSRMPVYEGLPSNFELLEKMGECVIRQTKSSGSQANLARRQWRLLERLQSIRPAIEAQGRHQMRSQV